MSNETIDLEYRLRAANPVPDLDEIRVGPMPGLARNRRVRRQPSRRVFALGGAVAVAVVSFLLVGGLDRGQQSGLTGVAQAAVAVLQPGDQILHIITRTETQATNLQDRTEIRETWLGPEGTTGRSRTTTTSGEIVADGKVGSSFAPGDEEFDPVRAARTQIQDGTLHPVGDVSIDGRLLQRFRAIAGETETVWDFDADTLAPVRVTYTTRFERGGSLVTTSTFTKFERLPATAANLEVLTPARVVVPEPRVIGPNGDEGPAVVRP